MYRCIHRFPIAQNVRICGFNRLSNVYNLVLRVCTIWKHWTVMSNRKRQKHRMLIISKFEKNVRNAKLHGFTIRENYFCSSSRWWCEHMLLEARWLSVYNNRISYLYNIYLHNRLPYWTGWLITSGPTTCCFRMQMRHRMNSFLVL